MATTIDKADAYSRPNARFDEDGQLEIRASAVGNCRRALWYTATGHQPSATPTNDSLTMLEAGTALEPVVLRAMERAGWEVAPADPNDPKPVSVQLAPNLKVTGHPDATGVMPLFGGEAVIEVKTRGGLGPSSTGGPWGRSAATPTLWRRPPSTPTGPMVRPATR